MAELKKCPFCGSTDVYETYTEEYSGTKNPEIFCNVCKAIFAIEDDSPYLNRDEDYRYRREKTTRAWNRRVGETDFVRKLPSVWEIFDVCPPEEDGVYLVTDHRGDVFPAYYRAKGYGKTGRLVTDKFPVWRDMETEEQLYEEEVIAWMELPEPFEG